MDFKSTLEEIRERLRKLSMLNDELGQQGSISSLQSDLAKAHLRELYNEYSELMLASVSAQPATPPVAEPIRQVQDEVEAIVEIAEPVVEPVKEIVVDEVAQPAPVHQAIVAQSDVDEKELVQNNTSRVETPEEQQSVLERFQDDKVKKEINKTVHHNKTLKQLIPLNNKFMFIREFFGNTIADYENFLTVIEPMTSKTEVLNYMQEHVWNEEALEEKQEAIERFIQIIDLRFED